MDFDVAKRGHGVGRLTHLSSEGHTGDGVLATFDGPARGVKCAQAIAAALAPLGLEIRAGLHTGEVERRGDDLAGVAVHIGARVGALAGPSEVLVSQTVKDLVAGSSLVFEETGEHELKGVPDIWRLYRVVSQGFWSQAVHETPTPEGAPPPILLNARPTRRRRITPRTRITGQEGRPNWPGRSRAWSTPAARPRRGALAYFAIAGHELPRSLQVIGRQKDRRPAARGHRLARATAGKQSGSNTTRGSLDMRITISRTAPATCEVFERAYSWFV
jgi:hypothetical protein